MEKNFQVNLIYPQFLKKKLVVLKLISYRIFRHTIIQHFKNKQVLIIEDLDENISRKFIIHNIEYC